MPPTQMLNKIKNSEPAGDFFSLRLVRFFFYALILLVPLLFFTKLTQNPFFIQYTILKVFMGVILLIVICQNTFKRNFSWYPTAMDKPFVGVSAVVLASVICSMLVHLGERKAIFLTAQEGFIFLFFNCIFMFYLTLLVLRKETHIKATIYLLFAVAGLASLYGILQYWGIEPIWGKQINPFGGRCISTFGNPAFLGSFLVVLLPAGLVQIMLTRNKKNRFFFFLTTSLMFTALIATSTRSSWLGFAFSLLVLIIFLWRKNPAGRLKGFIGLLLIIGIIAAALIFTAPGRKVVQERTDSIFHVDKISSSGSQRLLVWQVAFDIFHDQPVLGTGWWTLKIFYPWYQGKYLLLPQYAPLKNYTLQAHNHILQLLAETGILGLAAFIWLWAVLIGSAVKIYRKTENENHALLITALLAGILGMLLDNMLNVTLYYPSPAMVFWIATGMIFAIGHLKEDKKEEQVTATGKKGYLFKGAASLIMAVLAIVVIRTSINQLRAADIFFTAFTYAHVEPPMMDKAIAEYEKSLVLDPDNDEILYELGNAYAHQNELDKARSRYERAALLNPGYEEVFYNLGVMNLYLNSENEAFSNFEKVLKLNPNNMDALLKLGGMYIVLKNWPKARDYYEKMVSIAPDMVKTRLHLGNIYFALSMDDKAIQEYEKVMMLDPKDPTAYNNRGLLYLKEGKIELAKKDFKTVLRIVPYNTEVKKRLESLP
jgi:tetratricopeptide (TPR) repeat protein